MSKDNGGPAFPLQTTVASGMGGTISLTSEHHRMQYGMTLRDYFAAKATEEDIRANMTFGEGYNDPQDRAAARFRHADHMLKERAK